MPKAYSDTLTTAASGLVVSVEDARRNLDLDDTYRDADLVMWIKEATARVEHDARTALLTQTRTLKVDAFPTDGVLELPAIAPVIAVSSVAYLDADGASQALATTVYGVDVARKPARVYRKYNQSWPSTYPQQDAVTVTYTAGYGTADSVPAAAKSAILMLVRNRFEQPEADKRKWPTAWLNDFGYQAQIALLSWGNYP